MRKVCFFILFGYLFIFPMTGEAHSGGIVVGDQILENLAPDLELIISKKYLINSELFSFYLGLAEQGEPFVVPNQDGELVDVTNSEVIHLNNQEPIIFGRDASGSLFLISKF